MAAKGESVAAHVQGEQVQPAPDCDQEMPVPDDAMAQGPIAQQEDEETCAGMADEAAAVAGPSRRLRRRITDEGDEAADVSEESPAWLKEAMADSLRVFGNHIDARFKKISDRVTRVEQGAQEMRSNMDSMTEAHNQVVERLDGDIDNLNQEAHRRHEHNTHKNIETDRMLQNASNELRETQVRMAELEKQLRALSATGKPGPASRSSTGRPAPQGGAPQQTSPADAKQWPSAVAPPARGLAPPVGFAASAVGGQPRPMPQRQEQQQQQQQHEGWDTPEDILKQRCDEVVEMLGIRDKLEVDFQPVVGRNGTGNCAEGFFRNSDDVEPYKIRLRGLRKAFEEGRPVWIDHKKTREQLRPARTIHRGAECLEYLERSRPDAAKVVKDLARRQLLVNGSKAFWLCEGFLRPTVWATMRYTTQEIEMLTAYANTE